MEPLLEQQQVPHQAHSWLLSVEGDSIKELVLPKERCWVGNVYTLPQR